MGWVDEAGTVGLGTVTTGVNEGPLICRFDQPLNTPSVAPTKRWSELPAPGTKVSWDICDALTPKSRPTGCGVPFSTKCPPPDVVCSNRSTIGAFAVSVAV